MLKRRFWSILIASLLVILLPCLAYALSYEQVSQISQEVTVLIDGCSSGSGVLYKREGNIYSVLTARHVVEDNSLSCLLITPDKYRYTIEPNQISFPQDKIDLAVIRFESNKSYKLAEFGNSKQVKIGTKVYVAGAPQPSEGIPQRTLLVTDGNVVGIQPPQNGYEWIYSSATRPGMSGGAVLNELGKVIGIHGQGDRAGDKINLGIPIQTFLNAKISTPKPSLSPSVIPKKVEIKPSPKKTPIKESVKTQDKSKWLCKSGTIYGLIVSFMNGLITFLYLIAMSFLGFSERFLKKAYISSTSFNLWNILYLGIPLILLIILANIGFVTAKMNIQSNGVAVLLGFMISGLFFLFIYKKFIQTNSKFLIIFLRIIPSFFTFYWIGNNILERILCFYYLKSVP